MTKIVVLVLCAFVVACSGSVTIVSEGERIGTVNPGDLPIQPIEEDGGTGGIADQGGVGVNGGEETGKGGAGGTANQGGTGGAGGEEPEPTDCDGQQLNIELSPITPKSQIIVGGSDWVEVARYVVSNAADKTIKISMAKVTQVNPDGDVADASEVAVASSYVIFLTGSEVSADGVSFLFSKEKNGGLVIPPLSSVSVDLAIKPATVVSSVAANGQWHGVARSGHSPTFALTGYRLECDVADVIRPVDTALPNFMVLRKSVLETVQQPLPSNTLANGDMDLLKFAVKGSGRIKQFVIRVWYKTADFAIGPFKLRRNGNEIVPTEFSIHFTGIIPADDANAANGILGPTVNSSAFATIFTDEEAVNGECEYTLHANVDLPQKGSYLKLQLEHIPAGDYWSKPMTGFLFIPKMNSEVNQINIDTADVAYEFNYTKFGGAMVWSDASEVPHSSALGVDGGSRDWTNDAFVQTSLYETFGL